MSNKAFLILLGIFCLAGSAIAQEVRIIKMEFRDNILSIDYEIEDSNPNNEYLVTVYSSANKFSAPLIKVTGAVGEEVRAGSNRIDWSILEELGEYEGSLSLEIRARVFIPFVRLRNFNEPGTYKKGTQAELEWRPGNTNPVHIELYNDNTRMQGELNHPNNGKYTMSFSSDLKPGSNYRIKITDSKYPDTFVYTSEFKIKPRIPIWAKAIPVLGVGYLMSTLISKEPAGSGDLPAPPGFPSSN